MTKHALRFAHLLAPAALLAIDAQLICGYVFEANSVLCTMQGVGGEGEGERTLGMGSGFGSNRGGTPSGRLGLSVQGVHRTLRWYAGNQLEAERPCHNSHPISSLFW